MADDLGYGDLGCYGQEKTKTPHIDKLALQGMRFTQHYAGSTVCAPSRASLLTGLHTGHSPVRGNKRWTSTGNPVDMEKSQVTVAKELKKAGYRTAIIGKWGLAEQSLESMPLNQGFDYFFGYRKHRTAHHYYPEILWENNDPFHPKGNDSYHKKGQYSHDSISARAINFIEKNKGNSFFLYLAFTIPHFELTVPADSKKSYQNLGWEKRQMKAGHYRHDEDGNVTYAAMISRMDRDVGRIMAKLKELSIDKNTLVIFTSDNGHEFDNGFFDSNGPLRGRKRDLYEGGIRVPFIVSWPERVPSGSISSHISAFWDFLPTVCDLIGTEPPAVTDGISYLPTLLGKKQKKHDYLYWEFNEWEGPLQAIRKANWKAIRFYNRPPELYDLKNDIGEQNDLAKKYPNTLNALLKIMAIARVEDENFMLKPHPRILQKK